MTSCALSFLSVILGLCVFFSSYEFYKFVILKIKGNYFFEYSWPDIVIFSTCTAMFVGVMFYSEVPNHTKIVKCGYDNQIKIIACR